MKEVKKQIYWEIRDNDCSPNSLMICCSISLIFQTYEIKQGEEGLLYSTVWVGQEQTITFCLSSTTII